MKKNRLIIIFLMTTASNVFSEIVKLPLLPPESEMSELKCADNSYRLENSSVGLKTISCALKDSMSISEIEKILGLAIFQQSSKKNPFDYTNIVSFNRYNPQVFVNLKELINNEADIGFGKEVYDKYFKNISRIHYSIGKYLVNANEFNNKYLAMYKQAIADEKPIQVDSFMNCNNISAYIPRDYRGYRKSYSLQSLHSSNVVSFWFRRQMDGSFNAIYELLELVMQKYDSGYYVAVNSMTPAISSECEITSICPL